MRPAIRKILLLALPASIIAVVVALGLIEIWVRLQWDDKRGLPGFYLSDPIRGQRLAPGYNGWFAGVPVRINNLGFRDRRDYSVEKKPGTFRILVLGDSVTFGHGSLDETTYPFLLEQRLKAWRPEVNWEVWNLGVPGYNTRQELAYLEEVGPRYQPDLVVVGFYPNDYENNEAFPPPATIRRVGSAVQRFMQRDLYSFELYKRIYLTASWRLLTNETDRRRLEHLATEDALLDRTDATQAQQQLTEPEYFNDDQIASLICTGVPIGDTRGKGVLRASLKHPSPALESWLDAVKDLQALHASHIYSLLFFVNMAPIVCEGDDRFYDGGTIDDDDVLLEVLGNGTPAASSTRAFLHYRPSQMPAANGHSVGNSNRVKAAVLFDAIQRVVLPPVVDR